MTGIGMKRRGGLLGWTLPLLASIGCASGTGAGVGVSYVEPAPPPDRVEVIEVAPGPQYVRTSGY